MDTVAVLTRIQSSGLILQAAGDRLVVAGNQPLTEQQRQFIRQHKASLLKALAAIPSPTYGHRRRKGCSAIYGGHRAIADPYRDTGTSAEGPALLPVPALSAVAVRLSARPVPSARPAGGGVQ